MCSPKRLVFKILFFLLFCFFPCCPFVFPFKFHFSFGPSTPFWKTFFFWGGGFFYLSYLLPFPLLIFAGFFETSFANIPSFKTNLLSFLAVYLFCCSCFCFHVARFCFFLFHVGFFWCVSLYCSVFVLFLVLLSDFGKSIAIVFLAVLVFFESCWLEGHLLVCFLFFCYFSCVSCFQSKQ